MRRCAMFKVGLAALSAVLLSSASAKAAVDDAAGANATAAFGPFGVAGLAVAEQAPATFEYPSLFYPSFGQPVYTPAGPPMYTPVCWTQYVTIAKGNTLVNFPRTICQ